MVRLDVTVRWLDGGEDTLGPCSSMGDVMAKTASSKKCLAPDITVLQLSDPENESSQLVAIKRPNMDPLPALTVVWNPAKKSALTWDKAVVLHTNAHDMDGLKRALELQKSFVGNREGFAKECRRKALKRYLIRSKQSEVDFATRSQIVEILAFGPTGKRAKATGLAISAVRYCAGFGHLDILSLLLEKYAADFDMDECDSREHTPLGYAAYRGDVDACKLLIAHGADVSMARVDVERGMCWSPIPNGGTTDVKQLLFEHGATIGSIFGDMVTFDLTMTPGMKLGRISCVHRTTSVTCSSSYAMRTDVCVT
eukprot:GEMP01033904.1.p1 GENE.GEMP01033904.1~~GEMP01033904.1.p1  ORF type:complete len:311 (+),score=71.62 GEMP01033904.1:58-990(+)